MADLSGQSVIVTGAARGIGKAIALRLASEGASLTMNDLDGAPLEEAAGEARSLGVRVLTNLADVSNEGDVRAMVESTVAEFGALDIMIANAGIHVTRRILETSVEDFDRVMRINVRGVFLCGREAARHMIPRRSGKIINAASISGHRGAAYQLAYCASKFAVVGMTQSMAKEFGPFGITVNAYCPGIVDTRMWDQIDEERSKLLGVPKGGARAEILRTVPLGRMERPEDVAGLVGYLASPDSDYMTGQSINICGGIHML